MKRINFLIACILIFGSLAFAQTKIDEQGAIKRTHIDFTSQYIYFVIHGQIEIDGHTFYNDTCKSPIIFQATIDGVTIVDTLTKQSYTHRKCNKRDCKIIHLYKAQQTYETLILPPSWRYYNDGDWRLDTIKSRPNGWRAL
jgi:hypothetical protein